MFIPVLSHGGQKSTWRWYPVDTSSLYFVLFCTRSLQAVSIRLQNNQLFLRFFFFTEKSAFWFSTVVHFCLIVSCWQTLITCWKKKVRGQSRAFQPLECLHLLPLHKNDNVHVVFFYLPFVLKSLCTCPLSLLIFLCCFIWMDVIVIKPEVILFFINAKFSFKIVCLFTGQTDFFLGCIFVLAWLFYPISGPGWKICRFMRTRRSDHRQCMGYDLQVKDSNGASNRDSFSLKTMF